MKKYVKEKIPVVLAVVGYLFIAHKIISYVSDKLTKFFIRKYI